MLSVGIITEVFSITYGLFFAAFTTLKHYTVTVCSTDEDGFIEFHKRYQTLVIWFIDAANFIDLYDPRWEIMYL